MEIFLGIYFFSLKKNCIFVIGYKQKLIIEDEKKDARRCPYL